MVQNIENSLNLIAVVVRRKTVNTYQYDRVHD